MVFCLKFSLLKLLAVFCFALIIDSASADNNSSSYLDPDSGGFVL